MRKKSCYIGIDLGGTSLRALVVDRDYKILAAEKTRTRAERRAKAVVEEIIELAASALDAAKMEPRDLRVLSAGAPGAVDWRRGIVERAPNLGWTRVPLAAYLRKRFRVPVMVDNDVNVGVVGEHALGAGRGVKQLVGIFVGTGIGGGLIFDGKLYEGSRGGAGEIGHTVVMVDGPLCSCGRHGCIEALASRTAMERDVRAAIKAGRKSRVLKIMKKKGHVRVTSSVIHAALKEHDPVMREVMRRAQYYLGILAANAVNLLDPECVVFGGGLVDRMGEDFVAPIRRTARENFLDARDAERAKILPGSLGDNAGALGAVVLARQRLGL